ncbi:MAG: TIGR04133 family radical SAM/SPASM protein [Bacteroidales bacterium]|nr:TIGR04133 family radical SAM/SPASM protein [Bacteroidales bacterium]
MQKGLGLRKRFLLNIYNKFISNEAKIHELRYLFWECTLRCNLNCLHCGSDCLTDSHIPDMPAEVFLEQMRKLRPFIDPEKLTIVITGGEPLLRNDLEEIGMELRKMGLRWGMVSNALAYTPERHRKLMSAGMGSLTFSFDGLKESHNWLRNNQRSYDKLVEALSLVTAEKYLNYDLVTCVNQRNIEELPALRDLLSGLNVKAWRLFTIAPIGRAADNKLMKLKPEQFTYLMDFIAENRNYQGMKVSFSCEGFTGPYEGVVRDGFFFCRAGIHIGSILADGSVSSCPNIDRSIVQGSIYERDFQEIWKNGFDIMRNREWTKTGECKDCDMHKWCHGNGLHLWDLEKKELQFCHYRQLKGANRV